MHTVPCAPKLPDRSPARGSEANPPADSSYGLIHIDARYYAPNLGRWIMRDPIGMGGGRNVYVYVGNNPVSTIDPSGHMTSRSAAVVGGIASSLMVIHASLMIYNGGPLFSPAIDGTIMLINGSASVLFGSRFGNMILEKAGCKIRLIPLGPNGWMNMMPNPSDWPGMPPIGEGNGPVL